MSAAAHSSWECTGSGSKQPPVTSPSCAPAAGRAQVTPLSAHVPACKTHTVAQVLLALHCRTGQVPDYCTSVGQGSSLGVGCEGMLLNCR